MVSSQRLIQELKRLYGEYDRTPTRALMAGQGAFDPEQYADCFGSWNAALEAAGLDPAALDQERYALLETLEQEQLHKIENRLDSNDYETFFKGQLLAELHRLSVELGRSPKCTDMTDYGRYTPSSYRTHFGSWNAALTELGLELNMNSTVSKAELLADLQWVADEIDGCPRTSDIRKHGEYSIPTFYSYFDSWAAACDAAGVRAADE